MLRVAHEFSRIFIVLSVLMFGTCMFDASASPHSASIFKLRLRSNQGSEVDLADYAGKVLLIANTASRCGFTPQYKGLQAVYDRYKDRGLVVLGFPSNDFMKQEPGTDEEIKKFCELNYGVSFPLFSKAPVSGERKQELFKILTEESAENLRGEVRWNFEKFIVDKKGQLVGRFRSLTKPESKKITALIEQLL